MNTLEFLQDHTQATPLNQAHTEEPCYDWHQLHELIGILLMEKRRDLNEVATEPLERELLPGELIPLLL